MKKIKYEYVVIILVYRNDDDLKECVDSINSKIHSCKIIIVNAFYDTDSHNKIKKTAEDNGCDFLNIENKGYSYGNNYGINYAMEHYRFKAIIVSNPDIVVKKFDNINNCEKIVIAPQIIAASGKNQNPMIVFENIISEFLVYYGFKKNIKIFLFFGIFINWLIRNISIAIMKLFKKKQYKIFQSHGSFVIIGNNVINKLMPIYDEKMFLFAEEGVLAQKLKKEGIKTYYSETVSVRHKEDGSMKLGDFSVYEELKKASIYYYETYRKNKNS